VAEERNTGSAWLSSLTRFGIRPGLERTLRVLKHFDDPQEGLRFFHVAGTNGKGSVCANLYQLLRTRLHVGMFTSPAFDGYQGRFIVDDAVIPERDFERLAESVRKAAAAVTADDPLTEFEALTVMAILYFKECAVDAVVWETGLGGRYDSTNVVKPVVTAITNVGMDHVQILGPTIRHIAADKSGIIKEGCPIITAASGEALDVIRHHAAKKSAKAYVLGTHFGYTRRRDSAPGEVAPPVSQSGDGADTVTRGLPSQSLDYRGIAHDWFHMPVTLFGKHQCENTAVALAMLEAAASSGQAPDLTSHEIRRALAQVAWPGRIEVVVADERLIVLDGAHNPDGARTLADALREFSSYGRMKDWVLVVGVLADKDVAGILRSMLPLARVVIAVQPDNHRALEAARLEQLIQAMRPNVFVMTSQSVAAGLMQAMRLSEMDSICCFGSLYTVDEARKAMETMQHSGKQGR
jgi:dihydrofolate synthase / folylpolyglutamate synthase